MPGYTASSTHGQAKLILARAASTLDPKFNIAYSLSYLKAPLGTSQAYSLSTQDWWAFATRG